MGQEHLLGPLSSLFPVSYKGFAPNMTYFFTSRHADVSMLIAQQGSTSTRTGGDCCFCFKAIKGRSCSMKMCGSRLCLHANKASIVASRRGNPSQPRTVAQAVHWRLYLEMPINAPSLYIMKPSLLSPQDCSMTENPGSQFGTFNLVFVFNVGPRECRGNLCQGSDATTDASTRRGARKFALARRALNNGYLASLTERGP